MYYDLFSSFDYNYYSLSMLSWFMIFLLFNFFYFKTNRIFSLFFKLFNISIEKFDNHVYNYSFTKLLSILFIKFMFLNLIGLFPYIFSSTSQILLMMIFSLLFFLLINISSIFFNLLAYINFLVPQGSPLILGWFLSMIELMSNFMRPMTLSLRLGMKMTTGHMFLSLLGTLLLFFLFNNLLLFLLGTLLLFIFYYFFEIFVCLIQSFVYSLLISQYLNEHSL